MPGPKDTPADRGREALAGGNVTGVFLPFANIAAKRLQLLKETVPDLGSVALVTPHRSEA